MLRPDSLPPGQDAPSTEVSIEREAGRAQPISYQGAAPDPCPRQKRIVVTFLRKRDECGCRCAPSEHRAYASSEISDTLARLPMPSLISHLTSLAAATLG